MLCKLSLKFNLIRYVTPNYCFYFNFFNHGIHGMVHPQIYNARFLWVLHADHHKKDNDSWFERNDVFFIFYAVVSIGCFLLWQNGVLN